MNREVVVADLSPGISCSHGCRKRSLNNQLSSTPWLSVLLEQLAQTSSGLIAVQSPRCDIENEGFPVIGEQFRPRQQIIAIQITPS
jgi:hypothetical protein